jgi:DDE_Tnp_1-associated
LHIKKHLSFSALRNAISVCANSIDDGRQQSKVKYSLHDCIMSVLAMMFFQDPSLVAFQRRLQKSFHQNNLKTLFKVTNIPKDTQMRDVLDQLNTESLQPIFSDFLSRLQRSGHLASFSALDGHYLISLDGSEYFSSYRLNCPQCLEAKNSKGEVRYHHNILQAAMMHPNMRQVLPLAPEFIEQQDGHAKQDCEINAAKRKVAKIRNAHPKLNIIIVGDGLFSKQPFINELKTNRMSYILVAKPTDHKTLFEWVEDIFKLGDGHRLELTDMKKRKHIYRWANQLPLNAGEHCDEVNFFEYQLIVNGRRTYRNSWVTDISINADNIVELVKAGRSRWKIENEVFNTLKNQGYHIEHNFGHGQKQLSSVFFTLNLLAFFVHQILELTDGLYQQLRADFSSRKDCWNQLRYTIRLMIFRNWRHLISYLLDPPMIMPP